MYIYENEDEDIEDISGGECKICGIFLKHTRNSIESQCTLVRHIQENHREIAENVYALSR